MSKKISFPGSWIDGKGFITCSYDKTKVNNSIEDLKPLRNEFVKNYALNKFELDIKKTDKLCIINGMGVTLGDSIVGLSCLYTLKKIKPSLKITIIRPKETPSMVESVYKYFLGITHDSILSMPRKLDTIKADTIIDLGDQIFRNRFNEVEMHDYFYESLGMGFVQNVDLKSNEFLKEMRLEKPFLKHSRYVLFSPYASTPVRSIPSDFHGKLIKKIYSERKIPVLGFSKIEAPNYEYIGDHIKTTKDFIQIIAHSDFLLTVDSSAMHIAAGYDVPTRAIFSTIEPKLRSIYYKNCEAIYIGKSDLSNIHESEDKLILERVKEYFRAIV